MVHFGGNPLVHYRGNYPVYTLREIRHDSELILKHHANWRFHTISNLQILSREDLHYSACMSLSEEDAFRVKESILQNLKSNVETISKSKEEVAYVMSFDFYRMIR